MTPFRVVVAILERQPRDYAARRLYGAQLLRSWYGHTRMIDRTALIIMSVDGACEIAVGRQTRAVFSDAVARHFSIKAMELMQPSADALHADEVRRAEQAHPEISPELRRLRDTSEKLIFYVCFTVRSRTQMTAMSMRSMSMFMMLFMVQRSLRLELSTSACISPSCPLPLSPRTQMMAITATKQQQARRYAELYGIEADYLRNRRLGYYSPYGYNGAARGLFGPSGFHDPEADFWDEFETGRRGTREAALQEHREDAFFRMQVLQMLLMRGTHGRREEEEYDDDEYGSTDEMSAGEEEIEQLREQAAFYQDERGGSCRR